MLSQPSYSQTIPEELIEKIKALDLANRRIIKKRSQNSSLWQTIQEKLRVDWTYDSNAIEGSTLTRGETLFFLKEGLTVEGKPLKDFLDAKNHAEAIDLVHDVVSKQRPLSEGLMKEINALLLSGVTSTQAQDDQGNPIQKPASPGQYKQQPNHVLQLDGTIHKYTDPMQVPDEMEALVNWVQQETTHPIIQSAIAHYNFVRIHPFDDGNGRGARLLMNLILLKNNYPPAIIRVEHRRQYINALTTADKGDIQPFINFVVSSLEATLATITGELG